MSANFAELAEHVVDILERNSGPKVRRADITPQSDLFRDLGVDSLGTIELFHELEELIGQQMGKMNFRFDDPTLARDLLLGRNAEDDLARLDDAAILSPSRLPRPSSSIPSREEHEVYARWCGTEPATVGRLNLIVHDHVETVLANGGGKK